MEQTASMKTDERLGNLHINLEGSFSATTAKEVTKHIHQKWSGSGNIFIHTKKITEIQPTSSEVFQAMVALLDLSMEHIYFVGELGKQLCCERGKVIIPQIRKHKHGHGCGRCENCKCGTKSKQSIN